MAPLSTDKKIDKVKFMTILDHIFLVTMLVVLSIGQKKGLLHSQECFCLFVYFSLTKQILFWNNQADFFLLYFLMKKIFENVLNSK